MKNVVFAITAIAISIQCSMSRASVISSTSTLNQMIDNQINFSSRFTNLAMGINDSQNYRTFLSSGANSASVTTDTDSDTGFVSGLQFKPFVLPASTRSHNLNVDQVVVDVPANFPIPAVTHIENHLYSDRITITGVAPATPALVSTTTDPLIPLNNFIPWFVMKNTLTLASTSIIVQGTYEAIGPTVTRSVPFSVEFQPVNNLTQVVSTYIAGGQNFNDGFEFGLIRNLDVTYRAVNPVIFDEQVNELHFRASFSESNISVRLLEGSAIPEPGAMALTAGAAMALAGAARRRSFAIRWRR